MAIGLDRPAAADVTGSYRMAGRLVAIAIGDENRNGGEWSKVGAEEFRFAAGEAGRDGVWAEIAENGRFRGKRD